jgi:hypothetical protein
MASLLNSASKVVDYKGEPLASGRVSIFKE